MSTFADQIYLNGRINTQNPDAPWAESMAVGNGHILSLNKEEISQLTGSSTEVIDLQGKFLMPGLIDCHIHGLWGARQDVYECFVGYEASLEQLLAGVEAKAKNTQASTWISGGPWNTGHIAAINELGLTPRQWLDSISEQHPICLYDTTKHSMLANTMALDLGEVDTHSHLYDQSLIERDAQGQLNGLVHEDATGPLRQFLSYDTKQMLAAGQHLVTTLHRYGVTAMKEPMAFRQDLDTYQQLDHSKILKLHVFSHIARSSPLSTGSLSVAEMKLMRDQYRSENHHPDGCKLFLDGVAPSRTAAFFDPYVPCCCVGEAVDKFDAEKLLRISPADLANQLVELDDAGFTVKMHAVGDCAVNAGLTSISAARSTNNSGIKHEIAHTTFVSDEDFPRFKQLGAVAEVSPKIWFPTAITAAQRAILGLERANRCHPIKTLLEHGALVTYGSDWPAAVPDADPWIGMAGMITREHPKGLYPGHVGYGQGINLDQAIAIFTRNGATAMRMEDRIGQLKPEFQADFIVLDHHLDKIPANTIADTKVLATYFAGECVYGELKTDN
jgi:predicted amidohydrolase YtcJ